MVNCVNMKYICFLFLAFFSFEVFAGNCTTTTRTNYTTGQVLSSTALNADFNQLVSKVNSLDGGCVTDGTLEAAALNATDFAAVTNGIHQGCAVTYTDANTVSIDKCILSVAGNLVKKTTPTSVTWGCTGCASELSSSLYYIYAKTSSSGSTLDLLISTTAPGADGYDASSNKVLGSFYNNSSSAIEQRSLKTWIVNKFENQKVDRFTFAYGATATTICTLSGACGYLDQSGNEISSIEKTITGTYKINFNKTYLRIDCWVQGVDATPNPFASAPATNLNANNASFSTRTISPFGAADSFGAGYCVGYY